MNYFMEYFLVAWSVGSMNVLMSPDASKRGVVLKKEEKLILMNKYVRKQGVELCCKIHYRVL